MSQTDAPPAWSRDQLLSKAQDLSALAHQNISSSTGILLLSLAVELVARACVAQISPLLLTNAEIHNLTYAHTGKHPLNKKGERREDLVSRDAKEVFAICKVCVPGFPDGLADEVRRARNWDVHTGRDIWAERPRYYIGCCYLALEPCLAFLGTSHEDFYGASNFKKVEKFLANIQLGQDLEYNKLVGEATQRFTQLTKNGLIPTPAPAPAAQGDSSLTESIRTESRECPACKCQGQLTFAPWTHSDPIIDPKTREMSLIRTYMPTSFHCPTCSLTLSGKMLEPAKMDVLLERTEELDAFDYLNISPDLIREAFSTEELLTRDEFDDLQVGRAEKTRWEDDLYDDRDY